MLTLFFILSLLTGIPSEYAGCGWLLSNERHSENFFKPDQTAESGVYLSVGGDRAFLGAAMAKEAGINVTAVINVDRDPNVISFMQRFTTAARKEEQPKDFFSSILWSPGIGLKTWLVANFKYFVGIGQKSIYADGILFQNVRTLAWDKHTRALELDFNNLEEWARLIDYLQENDLKIAIFDISNVLDGYVSSRQLQSLIEFLRPRFNSDTLIVNTQFCGKLGHIKTHARRIDAFLERLKSSRYSPYNYPACITQEAP